MTLSGREVAALLETHGIAPAKSRGQNFVIDPNTVRRIVELAGVSAEDRVVEIGAGVGCLTLALLEKTASVTAIEMDSGLVGVLNEVLADTGAVVVHADAMQLDFVELLTNPPYKLVANLPYNVATPLVMRVLQQVAEVSEMLIMVQLEAALRFAASPSSKDYGSVTVRTQRYATAEIVGRVGANVFLPRPRVESALVRIVRRADVDLQEPGLFEDLVTAGFHQRRKMVRRSLAPVASAEQLEAAAITPTDRAENLGLADWERLAAVIENWST
jgi:16S rRNA (adenine1518-N6/adenine1519-N6)-dimethyltransferase